MRSAALHLLGRARVLTHGRQPLWGVAACHRAGAARLLSSTHITGSSGIQSVVDSWRVNCNSPGAWEGRRSIDWYTGKPPVHGQCPGVTPAGKITCLPTPNLATCTRGELRDYFDNTWTATEVLFAALQGEEPFYRPPYHNLRHPKIFYYAHPAVLYINKFRIAGLLDGPLNDYYEHIFATGVDEMQWDDLSKNHMQWPSVDKVKEYRKQVYDAVVDVIENHPAFDTIADNHASPFWAVVMGTEHERIHLETSSVLMRELAVDLVRRPEEWPDIHPTAFTGSTATTPHEGIDYPVNTWIDVEAGPVRLGKERSFPSYGWDNEYGDRQMYIKSFRANKYLVSNGEFLQFVKDEGYLTAENWTKEGWEWRCYRNTKAPAFWVPHGPFGLHQYKLRTNFEEIDLPAAWPVNVNYHEAKAFAAWKTRRDDPESTGPAYRIMTEPEHHRIRDYNLDEIHNNPTLDPPMSAAGSDIVERFAFNTNLAYGSESAVDALPPNKAGFHDSFGNVWQWMEDHMSALSGFKVDPLYDDFTMPCFDGEHNLILGGSYASTGDEASYFARFHFRPHFHQHSGFRLVQPNIGDPTLITSCMDNKGPFVGQNPFRTTHNTVRKYNEDDVLSHWLYAHYADAEDPLIPADARQYPRRLIDKLRAHIAATGASTGRVLDIGCSVGGMTVELARDYNEVIGLDISAGAIKAGKAALAGGYSFGLRDEGRLVVPVVAVAPTDVDTTRISLKQADAMCLAPDLGNFDAIVISNLLDRLTTPQSLIGRLGGPRGIVRSGGLLITASPYSWQSEFTPEDIWLGGFQKDGVSVRSGDALKDMLSPNFVLLEETDIPMALKMHSRQCEYLSTHVTIWQHK